MDASIILSGHQPNFLAAMDAGTIAAQRQYDFGRQRQYDQLSQQYGPGIMAGEPGAMNALAQFDYGAGLDAQNTRQGLEIDRERIEIMRAEAGRQAQEWARTVSADEVAAEREQARQMLMPMAPAVLKAIQGDPTELEALAQENGMEADDLLGMFVAMDGAIEVLDGIANLQPDPVAPLSPEGKVQEDVRNNILTPQQGEAAMQPRSGVNINVGGGSDKQVFDAMGESAVSARAAMTGLAALNEASTALGASGGAITGALADERLAAAKLGALFGITDPQIVQNTETFRAAIAPQVAAMMKATVGSTQISNADREFAERAAGGSITLDKGSITRLLSVMEKAAKVVVQSHRAKLDTVYPPGQGFDRERALFGVGDVLAPLPPGELPMVPEGVDPELWPLMWEQMDDKQKALFQ